MPQISLEEIDGIYEEIDEFNMIDNLEIIIESNSSVSNTNESQINSNGYLTPYHPVYKEINRNDIIDNTSECDVSEDAFPQITSGRESTSTSSDVPNRRSNYLNPYESIVHSEDFHEYLSIQDSGLSGSETSIKRASSYLNPYQPMIPSSDVHEYKSIHD